MSRKRFAHACLFSQPPPREPPIERLAVCAAYWRNFRTPLVMATHALQYGIWRVVRSFFGHSANISRNTLLSPAIFADIKIAEIEPMSEFCPNIHKDGSPAADGCIKMAGHKGLCLNGKNVSWRAAMTELQDVHEDWRAIIRERNLRIAQLEQERVSLQANLQTTVTQLHAKQGESCRLQEVNTAQQQTITDMTAMLERCVTELAYIQESPTLELCQTSEGRNIVKEFREYLAALLGKEGRS